jgi:hypothetical protein
MPNDPNRTVSDGWFVSGEPHEYDFFKLSIRAIFPFKTQDQLAEAILACRQELAPSEGREKLKECVLKRLGG